MVIPGQIGFHCEELYFQNQLKLIGETDNLMFMLLALMVAFGEKYMKKNQGAIGSWWSLFEDRSCSEKRRQDFFVKGNDKGLWHRVYQNNQFSGWESLGCFLTSDASYSSWNYNRFDVFVRGTDNAMWHIYNNGNGWSGWESLGGVITSKPVAVSWGNNRIDAFVIGKDSALWQKFWDNGLSPWYSLSGVCTSAPGSCCSVFAISQTFSFMRGTDNALWLKYFDGNNWAGWQNLGGVITSALSHGMDQFGLNGLVSEDRPL